MSGFTLSDREGKERIWVGKTSDRSVPLQIIEVSYDQKVVGLWTRESYVGVIRALGVVVIDAG